MKWAAYAVSEHHIRIRPPLFLEVYMKWSSMLHNCSEKTGLCSPVRERKTKSAFSKTKWTWGSKVRGKQWLSCQAVSPKYQWFPMNLPAEAEFWMLSQFWRDAGILQFCGHIWWVLVWKSECSYRRNQRKEEMHGERVSQNNYFKSFMEK